MTTNNIISLEDARINKIRKIAPNADDVKFEGLSGLIAALTTITNGFSYLVLGLINGTKDFSVYNSESKVNQNLAEFDAKLIETYSFTAVRLIMAGRKIIDTDILNPSTRSLIIVEIIIAIRLLLDDISKLCSEFSLPDLDLVLELGIFTCRFIDLLYNLKLLYVGHIKSTCKYPGIIAIDKFILDHLFCQNWGLIEIALDREKSQITQLVEEIRTYLSQPR